MVKLPTLKCLRCGFEWHPRVENPVTCAKCRSPYYNRPRHKDLTKQPPQ